MLIKSNNNNEDEEEFVIDLFRINNTTATKETTKSLSITIANIIDEITSEKTIKQLRMKFRPDFVAKLLLMNVSLSY